MTGDGRFVVAIVRGDYDVNETKLVNAIKATGGLRPAKVEEIKARGMEPGYGSPIGARDAVVVVDELVTRSPNLVAGANSAGWHVRNVNVPRDYTPDAIADITNAREGDPCARCGSPVKLRKGIEVGNIFKLGTDFTDAAGAMYLGEDGERHPIVMGSYGIGLGRNVACIVEAHHDEKGITWPAEVAPYAAHLVALGANREPQVPEVAEALHAGRERRRDRREILYDDRDESPGVKFTDAELLGHALDPHRQPALAGRGRRRGHEPRDGGAGRPLDRGRDGVPRGPGGDAGLTGRPGRGPTMPGALVPEDDLYARLEVDVDASPEAIELAWRALLKRHHPDVAGDSDAALDRAKRINVAHDWLSDAALRARYDRERLGLRVPRPRPAGVRHGRPRAPGPREPAPRPPPRRRAGRRARTSSAATRRSAWPGSSTAWSACRPTSSTGWPPPSRRRSRSSPRSGASSRPTPRPRSPRPRRPSRPACRPTAGRRSGCARACWASPRSSCWRRSSTTCSRSRSAAAPATACCGRGRRRSTSRATGRTGRRCRDPGAGRPR